jgi:methylmalonyl-CoA mutase cobalamin-binding subunit
VLIRDHGVARVFGPGTDTHDIVDYIHGRLGI